MTEAFLSCNPPHDEGFLVPKPCGHRLFSHPPGRIVRYFLPHNFRAGFQEALGNAVQMSVSTTQHLQKLRLLRTLKDEPEVDINFLLQEATDKLAFMPYAYLMDQWRWRVFDGTYKERDWNCAWWDLR